MNEPMMWTLLALSLLAQADDILAEEAKSKAKPAAAPPAAAPVTPSATPPATTPATTAPATTAAPAAGEKAKAKTGGDNSATAEPAAEDDAEGEKDKPPEKSWLSDLLNTGAMGYMIRGGIFMWPILILGVIAFGVIIERSRALMMLNTKNEALRSQVRQLLEADQIEEALAMCDRAQGPVPAILGAGLRKYLIAQRLGYDPGKIEELVTKGMDDYAIHIVAAMEKHLPILATVSSAAPMLGFLGTVSGMVTSFDEIVRTMGEKNIVEAAASGIMVSLLTTVLGLIVGLPAFIAFNYFTSAVNGFVLDVEESAAELIEAVTFQLALAGKERQEQAADEPASRA
jgi:biopolymer transport protein ExbB